MSDSNELPQEYHYYAGNGETLDQRTPPMQLPLYSRVPKYDSPQGYKASPKLRDAVNVAILLGKPLLVTGEPGCGKTQLAYSVAHELGLGEPLRFNAKTSSVARDLLYQYDALSHFHASQQRDVQRPEAQEYIEFVALGKAITLAIDPNASENIPSRLDILKPPVRSVVLIDEIDKAPRDFPNDLLFEVESLSFNVPETRSKLTIQQPYAPILIITSNSEKNVPDAFLRRCLFYAIPTPSVEELMEIVRTRLGLSDDDPFLKEKLPNAINLFRDIRTQQAQQVQHFNKLPATAELLQFAHVLRLFDLDVNDTSPAAREKLSLTFPILMKSPEDVYSLSQMLQAGS